MKSPVQTFLIKLVSEDGEKITIPFANSLYIADALKEGERLASVYAYRDGLPWIVYAVEDSDGGGIFLEKSEDQTN